MMKIDRIVTDTGMLMTSDAAKRGISKGSFYRYVNEHNMERIGHMIFFKSEKISPSTTRIIDITGVYCYLVEGSNRSVLIDTATGAGDLKSYVSKLTDKPVSVILTHGHSDHASGAAYFDQVYLNKADWNLVKYHASMGMKKDYVRFMLGDDYSKLTEEDFCPVRTKGYENLENGQIFHLGGVTLETVTVPGHTQGMTCILNQEERSILFGDACNPFVFLWDQEASSVEEYLESLKKMKKYEDRYDSVYLSHDHKTISKSILDGVIQVCEEIMEGTSDDQDFQFMGNHLKLAKKTDQHRNRLDHGLGNIVYNPDRIFKKAQ